MQPTQQFLRRRRVVVTLVVLLGLPALLVLVMSRPNTVDADVTVLPDDRTVRSEFSTNTCGRPLRLEIEETGSKVRVRTLVDQEWFLASCDDVAVPHALEKVLEQPLGDRELVVVRPRRVRSG